MKQLAYAAGLSFCIHLFLILYGHFDFAHTVAPVVLTDKTNFLEISVAIKKPEKKASKKTAPAKVIPQKPIPPKKIPPVKPRKPLPKEPDKPQKKIIEKTPALQEEKVEEEPVENESLTEKIIEKKPLSEKAIEQKPGGVLKKINPSLVNGKKQVYPRAAKKRNIEGTVILELFIAPDGSTTRCIISQSSGFSILDKAALKAAKSWKFTAGSLNGVKTGMLVKVPVMYKLD